jgi:very-short-patch-repair endonuclease
MDFLLLLPHGHRIVIEVDGRHHYTNNGKPDPDRYATNMRADRDLKLSGYEVFRFGTIELDDPEQARGTVEQFFIDLFRLFGIATSGV